MADEAAFSPGGWSRQRRSTDSGQTCGLRRPQGCPAGRGRARNRRGPALVCCRIRGRSPACGGRGAEEARTGPHRPAASSRLLGAPIGGRAPPTPTPGTVGRGGVSEAASLSLRAAGPGRCLAGVFIAAHPRPQLSGAASPPAAGASQPASIFIPQSRWDNGEGRNSLEDVHVKMTGRSPAPGAGARGAAGRGRGGGGATRWQGRGPSSRWLRDPQRCRGQVQAVGTPEGTWPGA